MEVVISSKPVLDSFEQIVVSLDKEIYNREEENRS